MSIDTHALLVWSCAGAIAKTAVAPIERVKLILQTQDLNLRIRRGEIPPYKGRLSRLAAFLASSNHIWRCLCHVNTHVLRFMRLNAVFFMEK